MIWDNTNNCGFVIRCTYENHLNDTISVTLNEWMSYENHVIKIEDDYWDKEVCHFGRRQGIQ